jgi:hypothetical protein
LLCWLALAYVAFAAAESGGGAIALASGVVAGLALTAAHRRSRVPAGMDRVSAAARRAFRWCAFGGCLFGVARSGQPGVSALDAAANLGAGLSSVAALVALARIQALGGVLTPPKATRSLDAAAFSGSLWAIATSIPAAYALLPNSYVSDPVLTDYATTSAAAGSLLVQVAAGLRLRNLRRVELGVGDRASGAFALSITAGVVAVFGAGLALAPPDRFLPGALVVAALLAAWAATASEPTSVTRALRGILAIAISGAPVVIAAAAAAHRHPHASGTILLGSSLACVVAGLLAERVARPLAPEQSRWLLAIEAASRGALSPDPDAALTAALMALQKTSRSGTARAEIWRHAPSEVLTVDVAGYLHVERAEAPAHLYDLALLEPERTLRVDALGAVEVRRPEVRPILAWLRTRGAYCATVVCDADGPLGFVLLPRESRTSPLTLEEARAVRQLADRISSLIAVSAALSRARERELESRTRVELLAEECMRLASAVKADAARQRAPAERLARRLRRGAYSPAARIALQELERLAQSSAPLALLAAPGIDVAAYAATAHLASTRRDGPFVVLDGTELELRERWLWEDSERSPLAPAAGGTLFIAAAAALPPEAQHYLAQLLLRRRTAVTPSGVPDAGLILGLPEPLAALSASRRLDAELARLLQGRELRLPNLSERAEDLRAIVLETLSQLGRAESGEPLGIEPAGLALLAEHDFPGNELELFGLLARAAARAEGYRVSAADLEAAGLSLEQADQDFGRGQSGSFEDAAVSLAVRRRSLRRAR